MKRFPFVRQPVSVPYMKNDKELSQKVSLGFDAKEGWLGKANAALDALQEAKQFVISTIPLLEKKRIQPGVATALNFFFQLDDGADIERLRLEIAGRLKIILDGLFADGMIKIGDLRHKETGEQVGGYVNSFSNKFYPDKIVKKTYHTTSQDSEGNTIRHGAIHIHGNAIISRSLIHEYSHKYIQTKDYFYFKCEKVPQGDDKWQILPTKVYDPADHTQGYDNADSYAYLVDYIASTLV
jgi:hypothetical protein